jgi:hypothetical protein
MELTQAHKIIADLGRLFEDALIKLGHSCPDDTPLMHGLAGYIKLDLKGEWPEVDLAYNTIINQAMDDYKKLMGVA